MARYIVYGICAVVVIVTFLYAAIKVMGEMKFQKYVIDELNSFGFRENLHNDFVKRRDKYKGKNLKGRTVADLVEACPIIFDVDRE
jgi:hypothetical protein